jgi:hypothetical protein
MKRHGSFTVDVSHCILNIHAHRHVFSDAGLIRVSSGAKISQVSYQTSFHTGPRNVGSSHLGPVVYEEIVVMMTREQLEALSNEDLLGKEELADLRQGEIASRLEDEAYELNDWSDLDLLGYDTSDLREAEIERRLEAEEKALGEMTDEDLLGKEYLDELRKEEIERRLGISDDQ